MEMNQPNVLYVQMFGNYQIYYNGHLLTGKKLRDTHFTNLMQILLHNAEEGVSRDSLENILLGDRDVEKRRQALYTIVYKAKTKLKKMGLPDEDYIYLKKGIYYWTAKIPVIEDAAVFDRLYRQAEACTDEDKRLKLYLEACYTYTGEFLSAYTAFLWAGAEAGRYRKQFFACVENAASIIRKKEDWPCLEELGKYVTGIAPFSDWESLIMEALVESGRYEEAKQFYADTVDSYLKERGVIPSTKIMNVMEKLGNQIQHSYKVLDQIQQGLEEHSDIDGGYQCSYPIFQESYHMVMRMMERGGQSAYLMLCTLIDSNGKPMKEGKKLEELSARLSEAIRLSVRHGDIINQYGSGQFLVLLINMTREDCEIVAKRINQKFIVGRQRISVQFHINSVICEA